MDIGKPYIDEHHPFHIIRTFTSLVDPNELIWHRDRKDREIVAVSGNGWKLQIDNEMPIELNSDEKYKIPKETFHRIIKGEGDLILKIKEY